MPYRFWITNDDTLRYVTLRLLILMNEVRLGFISLETVRSQPASERKRVKERSLE
jgi:hypothetical protein